MSLPQDQPDYTVPALGPISKESRLSWHSQLSNHGTVALWRGAADEDRDGKFFPRGCRGHISTIDVYSRAPALVDGVITVYISPAPGLGPTYQANIAVVAGTGDAWRTATFNRMWNYDSLFVFLLSSDGFPGWAYDDGAPYDYYEWDTTNLVWIPGNWRLWIRVNFSGETAGDVPVSGTLNTINIPSVSAGAIAAEGGAGPPDFASFREIIGAGKVVYMMWELAHYDAFTFPAEDKVEMRIEVDGAFTDRTLDWFLDFVSRIVNTPTDITFTEITTTEDEEKYIFHIRIPWEFKRVFRVWWRSTAAATGFYVRGDVYRSLIR